ncbi:hypothetical protein P4O66_015228, partial [Electrophorus voltai]
FNSSNGPLVSECPLENGTESSGKKRKRTNLPPGSSQSTHAPIMHVEMGILDTALTRFVEFSPQQSVSTPLRQRHRSLERGIVGWGTACGTSRVPGSPCPSSALTTLCSSSSPDDPRPSRPPTGQAPPRPLPTESRAEGWPSISACPNVDGQVVGPSGMLMSALLGALRFVFHVTVSYLSLMSVKFRQRLQRNVCGDMPVMTVAVQKVSFKQACKRSSRPAEVDVCLGSTVTSSRRPSPSDSEMQRNKGLRNIAMDSSSMGMPMSDPNAWATAMTNLGMAPVGMAGQPLLSDSHLRNPQQARVGISLGGVAGGCDIIERRLRLHSSTVIWKPDMENTSDDEDSRWALLGLRERGMGVTVLMHVTEALRRVRMRLGVLRTHHRIYHLFLKRGKEELLIVRKAVAHKHSLRSAVFSEPRLLVSLAVEICSDFDPSLGMMTGIAPMNPMLPGLGVGPPPISQDLPVVKEIIHCKSCTLFPPNPNLPPPATRERPPGCKTVFVGGLPENATEQIIVEVFEQCGTISAIRKSKKNFCHIRFNEEHTVDKALFLSGVVGGVCVCVRLCVRVVVCVCVVYECVYLRGRLKPSYRIRLGSSTDKKDTGRLHVDYAQARDDLYEWECRQRMLAREERHRRRIEEDRLRPPSPPPIVHYSEHECSQLGEKIKDDSKFPEAVRVLLTWVERGEVNRRNANNFYSMIQSSNSHIRRLMNEKAAHEKEMEEAKEKLKNALAGILVQFEQIVSVFHAASKQKAWDHFSKAQRKNLDMWRKQAEEIRNIHNEELMGIRREEEMEMSDDDMEDEPESKDSDDSGALAQVEALREENDSLRCQLDAYRNEVELLKQEQSKAQPPRSEEDTTRQQQLSFLQQALQGMQKILHTNKQPSGTDPVYQMLATKTTQPNSTTPNRGPAEASLSLQKKAFSILLSSEIHLGGHGGLGCVRQLLTLREDLKQREVELEKNTEEKQQLESQIQNLKERVQALPTTHTLPEAPASAVVSCSQEKESLPEKGPPSPVKSEREALLVGIISTFLHVHPFGASIEYICSYLQRLDTKISTTEVETLLARLPCTFRQELTGVGASLEKRWKFCGFEGIKTA